MQIHLSANRTKSVNSNGKVTSAVLTCHTTGADPEKYTDEDVIEKGQIIVFNKYGVKTVHRVVQIENINGQTRYYTKGDANDDNDSGFITDGDIYGFVHFKIPYVGYPTLMLRGIFK